MSNLLKLSIVGTTCLFLGFSSMSSLAAGSSPNTSVVNAGTSAVTADEAQDEEGLGARSVGTTPAAPAAPAPDRP